MERRRLFSLLTKQSRILLPTLSHTPRHLLPSNLCSAISGVGATRRGVAQLHSPSKPRLFPISGWDDIDPSLSVEEESIPSYRPEKFYPVQIGEVFNHRYQVVGKLGYGSSATVWLCRDLLNHRYIALKIYTASTTVIGEIEIYEHLKTIQCTHAGSSCLRPLLEIFHAQSPDGRSVHTCLVHPPLGISLDQLTSLLPDRVMSSAMVRTTMRNILAALDFLHTEARVIHTDLQPNNILLGIKDDSILSKYEEAEFEAPVPRKVLEDRTIYLSRPLPISFGTPVLCDLGEARLGTDQQRGDIMPDVYRAPEVILGMEWDCKVDIWNVGMVVRQLSMQSPLVYTHIAKLTMDEIWDLFEHSHLFKARDPDNDLNDGYHLAEMQAILGCPPLELLTRSERSLEFWDKDGKWKGAVPLPHYNLETREERLQGNEKDDFLRFLRRMLCWLPEERATAKELLFDPWLMHGLFK